MAECTIYDKLRYILDTKDLIKAALISQDVEVLESDAFRKYAEYITEIRKVSSVNGQTGDIVLKTINGINLVGEGNITVEGGTSGDGTTVDLTNYYTKEEIDNIIEALNIPSLDGYATEQWVENKGYLTEHQSLEDYAKKTDIPDVSKFITEEDIPTIPTKTSELTNDSGFITLSEVPKTDLNGYATEQWVEDKGYLTEHQQLKTINGESIVGEGNITIEGGSSSVAGVESIDVGGVYLNGKLSFSTGTESSDNSWRVGLNGEMYDSTTNEYYGNGGALIFGVKSSDNSIIITDGGSLADLTINPDMLSGGTSSGGATYTAGDGISISEDNTITNTGVTALNIGNTIEDWTQKTGIVNMATSWYDGRYEVQLGGTSFFGIKPIDNTITLENAGYTVNGNTVCGIKVNENNFKTINGESIIGEGNITVEGGSGGGTTDLTNYYTKEETNTLLEPKLEKVELTQAEYDALETKDANTLYVITDATDTTDDGTTYTAGNGISISEDNVISIKNINVNDTPSVLIGKNVNGDYYGSVIIGNDITNSLNASILIGSGVSNSVNNRTVTINIGNTFLADSNSNIYVWKGTETVKLQDYLVEPSDYYTKAEIDSLIGGVSDKISDINEMI